MVIRCRFHMGLVSMALMGASGCGECGYVYTYEDKDGDGARVVASVAYYCPGDRVEVEDCNDDDPNVGLPGEDDQPGCDGVDNDCDGEIDESGETEERSLYYTDADGDGVGLASDTVLACEGQEGVASTAGDCDDTDPDVHPGAEEDPCEEADEDCDPTTAAYIYDSTSISVGDLSDCDLAFRQEEQEYATSAVAFQLDASSPVGYALGFSAENMVRIYDTFGESGPTEHGDLQIDGSDYDGFGSSLAAGDLDEDGLMDLAIGAPTTSKTDSVGQGAVVVWSGTTQAFVADVQPHPSEAIGFGDVVESKDATICSAYKYYDDSDELWYDVVNCWPYGEVTDKTDADHNLGDFFLSDAVETADVLADFASVSIVMSSDFNVIGHRYAYDDTVDDAEISHPSGATLCESTCGGGDIYIDFIDTSTSPPTSKEGPGSVVALDADGGLFVGDAVADEVYYFQNPSSSSTFSNPTWEGGGSSIAILSDRNSDANASDELAIGGRGKLWIVYDHANTSGADPDLDDSASLTLTAFTSDITQIVDIGDVNGDGSPDLVVIDGGGAWLIYGDPRSASGVDSGER